MDRRIQELHRRALQGDPDAAHRWYCEKMRVTTDLAEQYEIMMEFFELSQPGLMKQLRETQEMIDRINKLIEPPPVDDGEWTTEIWISDNTHEDGVNQHPDLHTSYGLRISSQVSGATPDVFINSLGGACTVGASWPCKSTVVGASPIASNA